MSNTDLRDPEKAYNKMTVGNLSSLWPDVSVLTVFCVCLSVFLMSDMVSLHDC